MLHFELYRTTRSSDCQISTGSTNFPFGDILVCSLSHLTKS